MKDLIIRNKPIFIIGVATILIFVLLIILAQRNSPAGPGMVQIEEAELINNTTPVTGNSDSRVKLVEFSDFECPACGAYYPTIKKIQEQYGDKMLLAYRHFPLPQHTNARNASYAAVAAYNQGKFWEYADKLYTNQSNLTEDDFIRYAQELGLDLENFGSDYDSNETRKIVEEDIALAKKLRLNSTPSFVLNGVVLNVRSPQQLEQELTKTLNAQGYDVKVGSLGSPSDEENAESDEQNNFINDLAIGYEEENQVNLFDTGESEEETVIPTSDATYGEIEETPEPAPVIPGVTVVTYTEEGFRPKQVTAGLNTKIVWTNQTDREIAIEELNPKYEEFSEPVKIAPGGSLEFEVYKDKIWTYQESTTKDFGSILVL